MNENFVVHSNYSHLRDELHDCVKNFSKNGKNVTEGERNIIKKFIVGGIEINIKKFKNPNIFNSIVYKYLRKSKAKRSYEYGLKLIEFEIKTPFPIAYFEHFKAGLSESFYLSLHLNYEFDFRALIHNPKFENRTEILRQFALFTFKLHENGINFLDHSPGNTLIKETDTSATLSNHTSATLSGPASAALCGPDSAALSGPASAAPSDPASATLSDFALATLSGPSSAIGQAQESYMLRNPNDSEKNYEFYLIDLNRMRFEPMDFEKRMHNFRRLWLSKTMISIISEEYARLYGKRPEEVHALMSKYSRAFQLKVNSKKLRKRK